MNVRGVIFTALSLKKEEMEGKRILEIGSRDVNGSIRPLIEYYKPREYIGIDITAGDGVDMVCDVNDIVSRFGEESFDVVISTELMEHVRDWRRAIHALKAVCKQEGAILLTTRSIGFPYHGYPFDFWRYEQEDMEYIFQDCIIQKMERDPDKGIFLKVVKPSQFAEKDLTALDLYSIIVNKRVSSLDDKAFRTLYFKKLVWKEKLWKFVYRIADIIYARC